MKTLKFILIAAIAFSVASCCSCRRSASSAASLTETRWGLVSVQGQTIERTTDNFFLVFGKEDGRVSGRGDCNSIGAGYTARDGSLTLEPMMTSSAFCPNQGMEDKFTQALQSANGYSIDGNTLMLTRDGATILIFEAE